MRERTGKHRSQGDRGCRNAKEPSIEEMLADPIVRAIMAADGIQAGELEMLVRSAAKRPSATGVKDKRGPGRRRGVRAGVHRPPRPRVDSRAAP